MSGPDAIEEQRGALEPLLQLPRLIAGALDDVNTIARFVRYLPELAQTLSNIQQRVEALDEEVRLMRGDVAVMREAVEPLQAELAGMRGAVAPIARLAERLPRRRRAADTDGPAEPG